MEKDGRKVDKEIKRSKEGKKERMQEWTREGSEGKGQGRMQG